HRGARARRRHRRAGRATRQCRSPCSSHPNPGALSMPRFTAYVVALLVTWSRFAGAQAPDSAFVERGPRFLLASAAALVPVRVDVARTPVLRESISLDLNGVALSDALREVSAK